MGALCNEVVGMFWEIFLPGSLHQVWVPAECLWVAPLESLIPGQDLSPFGLGGSSGAVLGMVPLRGLLSTGSWGSMLPSGPGRLLGHGCGRSCWSRLAPTKPGRRPPTCLWAPLGWHIRQPGKQRGSHFGSCFPVRWHAPPGLAWFCYVAFGVICLRGPPGLNIPDGCRASSLDLPMVQPQVILASWMVWV